MSIRRIESAYATFLDDKRLSGTDMSVLVALAYAANEKRDEDCFPSYGFLAQMSHFRESAVSNACKRLRGLKIIDWTSGGKGRQGGNVSNKYRFLFPHCKMLSRRERYQQVEEPPTPPQGVPTPPERVPYPARKGTLPRQEVSNTEGTLNRTSEVKPEDIGASPLSDSEFKYEPAIIGKPWEDSAPQKERKSLVAEAMKVCGVSDMDNVRTFSKVMMGKNPSDCLEAIMTFESEIHQGEHNKAKNLAAILTKRFKALP